MKFAKADKIVTFALLFVMSFSLVHEYIFAYYDNEHCSISEYISEQEMPSDHGDICDIHYEYHHLYITPEDDLLAYVDAENFFRTYKKESYQFQTNLEFFKPPIA